MPDSTVFWPTFLGLAILVAGAITYRRDVRLAPSNHLGLIALGPTLVAASLAAFAGEHFTAAASLAQLVPSWLPARLFIAYFVGVAHLAAALSIVARRYVRWSSLGIALMFALFVLLMDVPGALARPGVRIAWSLAARETTYCVGGLALYVLATRGDRARLAGILATIARCWTAFVLVFYGIENLAFPRFTPGVPDVSPTASWVPLPLVIAAITGVLLVLFGVMMAMGRRAAAAAAWTGWLMALLTLGLFVPQLFLAHTVGDQVTAINFIFDTLLFGGTVLVIGNATAPAGAHDAPAGAISSRQFTG